MTDVKSRYQKEADRIIGKAVAAVHASTGGGLSDEEALLVAYERSVLQVAGGAEPESDEFKMYAMGRRELLKRIRPDDD